MVGIETEKEHNNIVEEVLRRIAENDLFVKLEKCIEGEGSCIFRSCNKTRQSKDGKGEGSGSSRLVGAEEYEKYTEVLRVDKLL